MAKTSKINVRQRYGNYIRVNFILKLWVQRHTRLEKNIKVEYHISLGVSFLTKTGSKRWEHHNMFE